jgi:uncharacterized protein (AIM24 family)
MKYKISKGKYPIVSVDLESGEKLITEHNKPNITWKSKNITKEVISTGKHKPFKQIILFGKNKVFDIHTAIESDATIAFSTIYPGDIKPVIIKKNQPMIIRSGSLIAMTSGIKTSSHLKINLIRQFFWHKDISLEKLEGEGVVFIEVDCSATEYNLEEGQTLSFNNAAIAVMDSTCRVVIEQNNVFKSMFTGNEIYRYQVSGPGKVIMQNMARLNY